MLIAIFDRCKVAVAYEQSKNYAIEEGDLPKLVAERNDEYSCTDSQNGDESCYAIGKLKLRNIVERHPKI